jgi:hypothetical protein
MVWSKEKEGRRRTSAELVKRNRWFGKCFVMASRDYGIGAMWYKSRRCLCIWSCLHLNFWDEELLVVNSMSEYAEMHHVTCPS